MKYKIGDKVKIISNLSKHGFKIGEVVVIKYVANSGDGTPYHAWNTSMKAQNWFLSEGEIEPYYDNFDEDFNAYEDKPPTKAEMHRRICEEMNKTYIKKHSDYGNSFGKFRDKFPQVAILMRTYDKFCRLEELLSGKERLVEDETIDDTLLDLANYCIMELVERRSK